MYKEWRRTKGDSENFVDKEGTVHGHVVKHKNNWRAFVNNVPVMDRVTQRPKNFNSILDARTIVETIIKESEDVETPVRSGGEGS